jgi:hypothetical protein
VRVFFDSAKLVEGADNGRQHDGPTVSTGDIGEKSRQKEDMSKHMLHALLNTDLQASHENKKGFADLSGLGKTRPVGALSNPLPPKSHTNGQIEDPRASHCTAAAAMGGVREASE